MTQLNVPKINVLTIKRSCFTLAKKMTKKSIPNFQQVIKCTFKLTRFIWLLGRHTMPEHRLKAKPFSFRGIESTRNGQDFMTVRNWFVLIRVSLPLPPNRHDPVSKEPIEAIRWAIHRISSPCVFCNFFRWMVNSWDVSICFALLRFGHRDANEHCVGVGGTIRHTCAPVEFGSIPLAWPWKWPLMVV